MRTSTIIIRSCIIILIILSSSNDPKAQKQKFAENLSKANTNKPPSKILYTYKILIQPNEKFGYVIYANEKKIIYQPVIPALKGTQGFRSAKDASAVAHIVIEKLKRSQMLPTVTVEELGKLKIERE
jgi:hypothetical protein